MAETLEDQERNLMGVGEENRRTEALSVATCVACLSAYGTILHLLLVECDGNDVKNAANTYAAFMSFC